MNPDGDCVHFTCILYLYVSHLEASYVTLQDPLILLFLCIQRQKQTNKIKCGISTKASLFYVLKPPASPIPLRVDCDTNRVDVTRLWFLPETTSILAAAGKTNPNDTIF